MPVNTGILLFLLINYTKKAKNLKFFAGILIGIIVTEIMFSIVYYAFLRHLFNTFEERYADKSTVKTFND